MKDALTASMEDYLEIIYLLVKKNKLARAKDIAVHLGVKKPSVTGALKVLSQLGLVKYTPYGYIDLTPKGQEEAAKIFRRHEIIRDFLENILKIPPDHAEEDACKIEHSISDKTLERLVEFVHFIKHCPRTGDDWIESFLKYCSKGTNPQSCAQCTEEMDKKIQSPIKQKKAKALR